MEALECLLIPNAKGHILIGIICIFFLYMCGGKKTVAEHLLPGRRKGDLSAQMVIFCKSLRDLLGSFTSIRSWGEAEEQRSAIATMPSLSHRSLQSMVVDVADATISVVTYSKVM